MIIESIILDYLIEALPSHKVRMERSTGVDLVLRKDSGGKTTDFLSETSFMVYCYGKSEVCACKAGKEVMDALKNLTTLDCITKVIINDDYSDPDLSSNEHRYIVPFTINFYEEVNNA